MKNRIVTVALGVGLGLGAGIGAAQASETVDKSFLPYKAGSPTHPVIKPGAVINQGNVEQAKDALDPGMYDAIKNGWYEVKVGPTASFDVSKSYVEATEKNLGKVSLGDKVGEIKGYVAGRPFPEEPQASDPRAGEKIAWNFKYGINWGDSAANSPTYWTYRTMADGKVERVLKMSMHWLNFMHRTGQAPMPNIEPNPSEMYRATYVKVLEPQDVADTQLLIHRYEDDSKLDSTWLYLGFQRRVRKLSTGQITDSFLGSDIMIEDFEGYNGRTSDMKWTFKGTRNILMPFYNHNEQELASEYAEPGYKFVAFGGKGNCFPNTSWQLRKAYEVDVTPVDPNHPVGKRTMFFDAQTMAASRTLTYDRNGKLWKNFTIGKAHPDTHLPVNKGTGIALDDMFSMVDVQAQHCTTGQFKGQVDPSLSPANRFSVDAMRSGN
ncbi:DUF1329 domain-containing protein [Magnetospirillum sp. 15-1]|uniref:DUF1329 domain-containing protein n=1 Tax=Magnetospirillum sp. 15-1 TaxID=1979370 RepID=UPI000BBB9CC2|nr:DUF1329 domain-containing protein [Magnetospirillum sp. 15-1]